VGGDPEQVGVLQDEAPRGLGHDGGVDRLDLAPDADAQLRGAMWLPAPPRQQRAR
jgi:hypothetical protein